MNQAASWTEQIAGLEAAGLEVGQLWQDASVADWTLQRQFFFLRPKVKYYLRPQTSLSEQ